MVTHQLDRWRNLGYKLNKQMIVKNSMSHKMLYAIIFVLYVFSGNLKHCETSTEVFDLSDVHIRYARLRCLQQFPQADIVNFTDTTQTQCFSQCFLDKTGLLDLQTRGLNTEKFIRVWENIEQDFEECLEKFDFSESLSGRCSDTYRKLIEFRNNCLELFEYTFSRNSVWSSQDAGNTSSKEIGQSAAEYCDAIQQRQDVVKEENSEDNEVSLLSQYKDKLTCFFENIHYLDAYGRVDETEINLSYQEALVDCAESRAIVHTCTHRANSKYQPEYLGNAALELQKCLKSQSPVFDKVLKIRDEISRQY